jgi:tRNA (guanine-N7-)-methyltransferase
MDKTNGVNGQIRKIRSFVRRAGRTTNAQSRAMNELAPQFLIPFTHAALDWSVFEHTPDQDSSPLKILEIGFGMGESTAHIAQTRSRDLFLGIEVHDPGVGALLKKIGELQLRNLRLIQHDAVEVLEHMIAEESLDGVHIFFPDPWHKKRHHKRRLIQKDFLTLLVSRLKTGGYIHLATDWQHYAEQMLLVLNQHPDLKNCSKQSSLLEAIELSNTDQEIGGIVFSYDHLAKPHAGYVERPAYRPTTKFENRGLKLGHGVWDLLYRKK